MSVRRLKYGSFEHQQREIYARDVHAGDGGWMFYGNGESVLVVQKQGRRTPICDVIGEDGRDEFGEDFRYEMYFTLAEV